MSERFKFKNSIPVEKTQEKLIKDEDNLISLSDVVRVLNSLCDENAVLVDDNVRMRMECEDNICEMSGLVSRLQTRLSAEEKKHQATLFKLNTLEKFYTCPQSEFNGKETSYLRKLRKKK